MTSGPTRAGYPIYPMQLLGVDTGGTFTDFFAISPEQLTIHKTLSTPDAPEQAIMQGIADMGLAIEDLVIIHGSTVATNAALEGKGAKTLYLGNRGLADILLLARQTRPQLYELQPRTLSPFADTTFLETGGRLAANGELIDPISDQDIETLRAWIEQHQPEAVAINLLFSFLDDSQEKKLASVIPEHIPVSRSSTILPLEGEYERGIATWLNARLTPLMQQYLQRLKHNVEPAPLAIMQSSGGTIDVDHAQNRAVNLLLSGPAGGLSAARYLGELTGKRQLMTFDMGGTSTDVALLKDDLVLTTEGRIAQYPIAIPMVDMHTIGAGGGSIAYIDEGGILQVGPESAGASPGPACYGKGGESPTVTDANTVLGRLLPDQFLGGRMSLDTEAAWHAIHSLAEPLGLSPIETALGIVRVANEHMVRALRTISVAKGHNPSQFQLCCFGGAGGLHVCDLARQLRMDHAIVPVHGGIFSALGMTVAPRERLLTQTHRALLHELSTEQVNGWLGGLSADGTQQLLAEGVPHKNIRTQNFLELRYLGQSFTLITPWQDINHSLDLFHQLHQQRYGHRLSTSVELLNLRCRVYAPAESVHLPELPVSNAEPIRTTVLADPLQQQPHTDELRVPVYLREQLGQGQQIKGPALICEQTSTTYIAQDWHCQVDPWGNLLLHR